MPEKRKRGRPRKADAEKWGRPAPIRLDGATNDAITGYQSREGFATRSEAIRQLLRRALKAEGFLT